MARPNRPEGSDENTPLIPSSAPSTSAPNRSRPESAERHPHILYVLGPAIFIYTMGSLLPTTTILELARRIACQLWYVLKDPESIPADGEIPDKMCRVAGPESYFATINTIMALMNGIGHFFSSSAVAKFSNRYGRKPVYIVLAIIDIIGIALFIVAGRSSGSWAWYGICGSLGITSFAGSPMGTLVVNMMVVDTVDPLIRTSTLSRLLGLSFAGAAPSYALGGFLTEKIGAIECLIISAILLVINLLYAVFILPETLTAPLLEEAHEAEEELETEHRKDSILRRFVLSLATIIEPLKYLIPHRDPKTGRRNPRLFLFAIGGLFYTMANSYIGQIVIIYGTAVFNFGPADVGSLLSILQIAKVAVLFLLLPSVLYYGRALYERSTAVATLSTEEESSPSTPIEAVRKVSTRFDVHLVLFSWIWEATIMLLAPLAPTKRKYLATAISVAIAAGWRAGFDSAVVASAHPLDSGSILSAMYMVVSVAELLSPLILGTILSQSIEKLPELAFFVAAGFLIVASITVLFVKDSDTHSE